MKPSHRWMVALSTAALAVALGFVGWGLSADTSLDARRFPDGSVLTLEGVTYGRQHTLVRGSRWKRLLYPLLSSEQRQRLGIQTGSVTASRPNALVFWFNRRLVKPDRFYLVVRAAVLDEHGTESDVARLVQSRAASTQTSMLWELPIFPRRGKTVGLRLVLRDLKAGEVHTVDFSVPNPAPGPYAPWTPEPLPAAKSVRSVRVTVLDFVTGPARGQRQLAVFGQTYTLTTATLRVTENGRPSRYWKPTELLLTDATGNVWRPRWSFAGDGAGLKLQLQGALWPEEPAWKLAVTLERTGGFPTGETWTIRRVRIPRPREFVRSGAAFVCSRGEMRLVGISGSFARDPSGNMRFSFAAGAELDLPSGANLRFVTGRDERGRAVRALYDSRPEPSGHPGRDFLALPLRTPPGAKSVDLTFTDDAPRTVVFLAKPVQTSVPLQ